VIRGLTNIFGVLASAAVISGCAPASPGASSGAPSNGAPTFVSLNPCLDAILVEVAKPEQILSISHYSHQPGGSRMAREVAMQFASNGGTAEEIIALEPDIVLASVFLPPATKAALERAGLPIETFDSLRNVAASAAQVERIAGLTGVSPAIAAKLGASLLSPAVSAASDRKASDPGPNPSVLLWQAGQIVAGQETLIAELLDEAGFSSHSAALGLSQADHVTLEQVISDPPDLLLVAGTSAGQQHPALETLENTRTHYFDPSLFYCGGPSVAAARKELKDLRESFGKAAS